MGARRKPTIQNKRFKKVYQWDNITDSDTNWFKRLLCFTIGFMIPSIYMMGRFDDINCMIFLAFLWEVFIFRLIFTGLRIYYEEIQ